MNTERWLAKLRWDGPGILALRLISYWQAPRLARRRRRTWQTPTLTRPDEMPPDANWNAARQLWPGAADRSWIASAAERWPDRHAAAAARAAQAAEGHFDLLGSGATDARRPDGGMAWHRDFKAGADFPADALYLDVPIALGIEGSDIKVPWELSRFQHVFTWLWTNPDRYRDVFLAQWHDWLDNNPVARGVNWKCAMDVALRAVSWTAACAAWSDSFDDDTQRRMWAALADHGQFIRGNLEAVLGPNTNHYFSDLVGLAVIGAVLRPHPPATKWLDFAARELRREIMQQFAADGFNRECSTTYHRLMVELALVGWRACQVGGHDLGPDIAQRLRAACFALYAFSDSNGAAPLIGDNDSGRVFPLVQRDDTSVRHLLPAAAVLLDAPDLALADATPELALLAGSAALDAYRPHTPPAATTGRALTASGLFLLGTDDDHLLIRCGPLKYTPVGSHRHLDQLSLTATVGGRQIIVDPGQYCYTTWPDWRLRFIDSRVHNTIVVDDQPQCRLFPLSRTTYSIINEAAPRVNDWRCDRRTAGFVGTHRGYQRLAGGGPHERRLQFDVAARRWTLVDTLALTGQHRLRWRFQLHPDVQPHQDDQAWRLTRDGRTLRIRHAGRDPLDSEIASGWYAPAYGVKVPAPVLVFTATRVGRVVETFEFSAE